METVYLIDLELGGEDVTLRARRLLGEAALVLARGDRLVLAVQGAVGDTPLLRLDGCAADEVLPRILSALETGDVAWAAGGLSQRTPDDGALLGALLERGIEVLPVPGGERWSRALILSGLPAHSFAHLGQLPLQAADRRALLASVSHDASTLIVEVAAGDLAAALADIEGVLGGRQTAICLGERCWFRLSDVPPGLEGDATLVIAGARPEAAWTEERIRDAICAQLARDVSARDVASAVAEASGWRRKAVYRIVLEMQSDRSQA